MAQRKPFAAFFQDSLKIMSFCPLCETHYNPMEAKIIEQYSDAHLIHVQCRRCLSSIIVLVSLAQSGAMSVAMITDLTADDVTRLGRSERITCDDVLNFHEIIRSASADTILPRV